MFSGALDSQATALNGSRAQITRIGTIKPKKGDVESHSMVKKTIKWWFYIRVNYPQTNGKLERFCGELQRRLGIFIESDYTKTVRVTDSNPHAGSPFNMESNRDDVSRFIDWYNNNIIRSHMSLNEDIGETPSQTFKRKIPPKGRYY